jgi:hypothetical protein
MPSEPLRRFEKSMEIGYEQWHDGMGYDVEAIDKLSDSEKREVERKLVPRAANDWRDLEALDRLGTPAAIQAILRVRSTADPQIRLTAHQYGPEPSPQEWEQVIVASLETAEIYSGLTQALSCATSHSSQAVESVLWRKVRDPESGIAYHCASALCCIKGLQVSEYDDTHRALFLRLVGPDSPDRAQAVQELESLLQPS